MGPNLALFGSPMSHISRFSVMGFSRLIAHASDMLAVNKSCCVCYKGCSCLWISTDTPMAALCRPPVPAVRTMNWHGCVCVTGFVSVSGRISGGLHLQVQLDVGITPPRPKSGDTPPPPLFGLKPTPGVGGGMPTCGGGGGYGTTTSPAQGSQQDLIGRLLGLGDGERSRNCQYGDLGTVNMVSGHTPDPTTNSSLRDGVQDTEGVYLIYLAPNSIRTRFPKLRKSAWFASTFGVFLVTVLAHG